MPSKVLPAFAGQDQGANWNGYVVEAPPDYSETDPLQVPVNEHGGLSRVNTIGSFSSESTGSFSDDEDDDVTAADAGPNWSGA